MAQKIFFGAGGSDQSFRVGQGVARSSTGPPGGVQRCQVKPRKAVQQRPVAARIQQTPIVLLTVQFDQGVGQVAQDFSGGTAVVDESRLAAIGEINSAQDKFVFGGQTSLGQNG